MIPLLWAAPALAQAPCPDRNDRLDLIDEAEQALVEADLATVDRRLRKLDEAWGCGSVADDELLGRVWLIEGAYLTLQGDAEAGHEAWRAAARVAPGLWVDAFGDRLRQMYEQALDGGESGVAQIVLDPPLLEYVGTVDGEAAPFPAEVAPGLHLIQVGPDLDRVVFSRSLLVQAGGTSIVQTGLIEGQEPAADTSTSAEPVLVQAEGWPIFEAAVSLHIAAGGDLAMGVPRENAVASEGAVKLILPIETGVVVRPTTGFWVRGALMAAPVIGSLIHDDEFGPHGSSIALGPQLSAGGHTDQGDFGALAGLQWPGRVAVRALYSGRPSEVPVRIEGRVGLNLVTGAPPEPALGVVVAFTPLVVDRPPRAQATIP